MSSMSTTTRGRQVLRGLVALFVLLGTLGGVPILLVVLGGNPLPDHVPALAEAGHALMSPDDGTLFLRVLTVAGWIGWATFALSVLVEVPSSLLRRPTPRLPGLRTQQRAAAALIAAIALLVGTSTAASAAVAHAPATVAADVATTGAQTAAPAMQHGTAPWSSAVGRDELPAPASGAAPWSAAVARDQLPPPASGSAPMGQPAAGRDVGAGRDGGPGPAGGAVKPVGRPPLPVRAVSAPPAAGGGAPGYTVRPMASSGGTYVVAPGDRLADISARFLGDPDRYPELAAASGVSDPDEIRAGQRIVLPPGARDRGASPYAAGPVQGSSTSTYVIASGDRLSDVSERFLGDPDRYPELATGSGLQDPDEIRPGQHIVLPPDARDRGADDHAAGQVQTPESAPEAPPPSSPSPGPSSPEPSSPEPSSPGPSAPESSGSAPGTLTPGTPAPSAPAPSAAPGSAAPGIPAPAPSPGAPGSAAPSSAAPSSGAPSSGAPSAPAGSQTPRHSDRVPQPAPGGVPQQKESPDRTPEAAPTGASGGAQPAPDTTETRPASHETSLILPIGVPLAGAGLLAALLLARGRRQEAFVGRHRRHRGHGKANDPKPPRDGFVAAPPRQRSEPPPLPKRRSTLAGPAMTSGFPTDPAFRTDPGPDGGTRPAQGSTATPGSTAGPGSDRRPLVALDVDAPASPTPTADVGRRPDGAGLAGSPHPTSDSGSASGGPAVSAPAGNVRLDAALRALAVSLADRAADEMPDVLGAWLEPDGIKLILSRPCPNPPSPWSGTELNWILAADAELPEPAPMPAPLPMLVTVGTRDSAPLLLDLERLGVLTLTGDEFRAEDLLRYLGAELAGSPWSDDVEILVAGFDSEQTNHFAMIGDGRIEPVPTVADGIVRMRRRVSQALGVEKASAGRHAATEDDEEEEDEWAPTILLAADPDLEETIALGELDEELANTGRCGVGIVTAIRGDLGRWPLAVTAEGAMSAGFLGIRAPSLVAARLSRPRLGSLAEEFVDSAIRGPSNNPLA
ncbi:LysM peptidoglycan-binding domain-containing protein [Cryptosporangium sp. NPDC051539]|uniref:LysM peptidoglycan-binding domain-containing protein n=1 Tax=Cryptosporangium sp. NPDC051539 TaxID=3363962 RepID=UPI0037BB190E